MSNIIFPAGFTIELSNLDLEMMVMPGLQVLKVM